MSKKCFARTARDRKNTVDTPEQGELPTLLLHLLAWGVSSAVQTQQFANAAQHNDITDEALNKIAEICCSGAFPANTRRDILRRFTSGKGALGTFTFECAYNRVDHGISRVHMDFLLGAILSPLRVFGTICRFHNKVWSNMIAGPENCWANVKGEDPKLNNQQI